MRAKARHTLSSVDLSAKTANCAICGPTTLYVWTSSGGQVVRICSHANSQHSYSAKITRRDQNRLFLDQYKLECGCARCGYNESAVALDCHHRDPSEKDRKIAKAISQSRAALLRELEKCDILCANCHRIVHSEEGYPLYEAAE